MSWKDSAVYDEVDEKPEEQSDAKGWQESAAYDRPVTSAAKSFGRGVSQGATLGFSDELGGGVQALTRKAIDALGLGGSSVEVADEYKDLAPQPAQEKTFAEYYTQGRESEREANRRAAEDNPLLYGGGEFAGSVLSSAVPGVGLAANAGKAKLIGQAALQGGVAGLGGSEADLTAGDVTGALADTAKGAVLGAGMAGATQGLITAGKAAAKAVRPLINRVGEAVSEGAEDVSTYLAKKALGFERGSTRKLGEQKANAAAEFARENGLISSNADEMLKNVQVLKQRAGKNIGEMYETLDHFGVQPDVESLATRIQNQMERGSGWANDDRSQPMLALQGMVKRLEEQTGQPLNVRQLADIKRGLNAYGGWNKPKVAVTEANEAYREAAHEVSNYIDELIEGAEHQLEGGTREAFLDNKRIFGAVSALEDPLINKSARETGNKLIGLGDTIVGSGVVGEVGKSLAEGQIMQAAGKAAFGGAAIAGKKAVERFGPALGTHALHSFSERLQTQPASFGRYAPALQQAAARGGNALAVSLFILQQNDPEFRQTVQENEQAK
jgi:hypothetical protein